MKQLGLFGNGDNTAETLYGALQAAIMQSGINEDLTSDEDDRIDDFAEESKFVWEQFYNETSDRGDYLEGSKLDGMWGTMTQANLLALFGTSLTVRSDTFKIRVYGSARNPMTGEAEGEAWLEAIVQRMPDYLVSKEDGPDGDHAYAIPEFKGSDGVKNKINDIYGRKFEIMSVRWLSEDEI